MAPLRRFLLRLYNFFQPGRAEDELARELAAHLAMLEDHFRTQGMTPDEARLAARRVSGGVEQTKELHREARSFVWLDDARRDVRYAIRSLGRNRGFTIVAVLTIAIGIGATTVIFSIVNNILIRPLPYENSDRLVRIVENLPTRNPTTGEPMRRMGMNQAEFLAWRKRTQTLSGMAGVQGQPAVTLITSDGPTRVASARVSPALFQMLGAKPLIGRVLDSETDEKPDANSVVLSTAAWQRHFASDPRVLGRTVKLNTTEYTVVGVMPATFAFPSGDIQFWTPLAPRAGQDRAGVGQIIARLNADQSIQAATMEANVIGSELRPAGSATPQGFGSELPGATVPPLRFEVVRVKELEVAPVRPALRVLAVSVGLVLLIVGANFANLLLAKGTTRQREIGIRLAIGASRARVIRQVLTESAVVSLVGGLGGVLLAVGAVHLVKALATTNTPFLFQLSANLTDGSMLPRLDEIAVDRTVLVFALSTAVLTGLLFGLAPAVFVSRMNPSQVGSLSSRGLLSKGIRVRNVLAVTQLVLATTLLLGAGLLIHSFLKLSSIKAGYDPTNVLTWQLVFPEQYSTSRRMTVIDSVLTRLRSLPSVEAAGFTNIPPLLAITEHAGLFVPPGTSTEQMLADPLRPQTRSVSPDYLRTLGTRLLDGRWLKETDGAGQPNVMLVNQTLAHRYFGATSPVGALVRMYRTPELQDTWQIVGVIEDVRQARVDEEPYPLIFMDTRQMLARDGGESQQAGSPLGFLTIAVRIAGAPESIVPDARALLRGVDSSVGFDSVATMEQLVSGSLVRPRFYAVLFGVLAGLAGALAAIGVYGVLALAVGQRTQEIGIRMALGAQRSQVLRLVLRQGGVLTIIGVAGGVMGAAAVTRYLAAMLYGLTPLDPTTFVAVSLLIMTAAMLASYVPARRATKVDPIVALRYE